MGIQLDWEVESDLGREAVAEDAQTLAVQKRRIKRIWFALLAVVISLLLMAALGFWRYQVVQSDRIKALVAAVEAEALALRLGDKHKFMQLQGSSESWRASQRGHFDEIQALGVDVNVTGEVRGYRFIEDEAEVLVEIIVDGVPQQGAWLYEYTEKGWKHVATWQSPWYTTTTHIGAFTFTFNSVQRPDVEQLKVMLRQWWADASTATGIDDQPQLHVIIESSADSVRWENSAQERLLIPATVLANAKLDDPSDPLRIQLAVLLADQWADHILPLNITNSNLEVWQNWQIGLGMQSVFGMFPDLQFALGALGPAFGPDVLRDFMAHVKQSGDGVEALQQALIENAPDHPDEAYFESVLEFVAAASAYEPGLRYDASGASLLLIDADNQRWAADFVMNDWLMGTQLGTIRVQEIEQVGDLVWVSTTFDYNPFWYDRSIQADIRPMSRQIAFREVGGYWRITSPSARDWGENIEEQGEYVALRYSEIDEVYYRDKLPMVEEVYLTAAADFGIENPPIITVTVQRNKLYSLDSEPDVIRPNIGSPRVIIIPGGMTVEEAIHYRIVESIYFDVFEYVAEDYINSPGTPMMDNALSHWAMRQHGWESPSTRDWRAEVAVYPAVPVPDDWNELWGMPYYDDMERTSYHWALIQIGSDIMVETLMFFGGEEAFIPLVQNVREYRTADEWVRISLSYKHYDEMTWKYIEEVWQGKFYEEVRRIFGDAAFQ